MVYAVNSSYRKLKGGRQKSEYLKQIRKLAVFDAELVNVHDLNTKIDTFQPDKVKHELKVAKMYEEIVRLKTELNRSENEKETLKNNGARYDDCNSKSKSRLKSDLKNKMNDALWFAETYGLFPRHVVCESFEGQKIEIAVGDTQTKGVRYSALPDTEKDKLRQIVYICDKFYVSDSAYHEFSSVSSDLPSVSQLKDCRNEFNDEFEIQRTPGSFPGAFLSFDTELRRAIAEEFKETKPDKICVKLAGDGAKVTRISNFVTIQFSVLSDKASSISYENQRTLAILKCAESYENIQRACGPLFHEINERIKIGKIELEEQTIELDFFLGGDMKFLQMMLGLCSSSGAHCCPWCIIHKDARGDTSKPWDYYHLSEQQRSIQNIRDRTDFGVKNQPLLNIEPEYIVPDELHLLLRVSNILLRNLIDDCLEQDCMAKVHKKEQNHLDNLCDKIRECGVNFSVWKQKGNGELDWSSLTGNEMKLLLKNLPDKLLWIISDDTHESVVKLWRDFYSIYQAVVSPKNEPFNAETTFQTHKQWVDDFIGIGAKRKGYGASKITPYIHTLMYHVPFFVKTYGCLSRFSCQSVEKNNDIMKTIHFRKSSKVDGVVDAMAVRKRMELNFYADRERPKRKYDKLNENYWEYQIGEIRQQKCRKILSEIAEANMKYPQTETVETIVEPETIDSLSTDEIKAKLKSLGVRSTAKKRETLLKRLKEKLQAK